MGHNSDSTFTRQHYEAVAEILRKQTMYQDDFDRLVIAFSNHFADDNDAFDAARFSRWCYKDVRV